MKELHFLSKVAARGPNLSQKKLIIGLRDTKMRELDIEIYLRKLQSSWGDSFFGDMLRKLEEEKAKREENKKAARARLLGRLREQAEENLRTWANHESHVCNAGKS